MRTHRNSFVSSEKNNPVGMKPLSERDENTNLNTCSGLKSGIVGMKPLSERDENWMKINPPPGEA